MYKFFKINKKRAQFGGALPVVIIMGGVVATTTMYFSKETFHLLKSEKLHSVKATSIDSNFNSLRTLQAMMRFPQTDLTPSVPPKSYDVPMLYPEPYSVLGDDGSVAIKRIKSNPVGFPFNLRTDGATFRFPYLKALNSTEASQVFQKGGNLDNVSSLSDSKVDINFLGFQLRGTTPLGDLRVQVSNSTSESFGGKEQTERTSSTEALIEIPTPPDPNCYISPADPSRYYIAGDTAVWNISAQSIVRSAIINGSSITVPSSQTIRSLKAPVQLARYNERVPTPVISDPTFDTNTRSVKHKLPGPNSVVGVSNAVRGCVVESPITVLAPPTCRFWPSRTSILEKQTVTLYLQCFGVVDNARLHTTVPVPLPSHGRTAALNLTLSTAGVYTFNASASGPAGAAMIPPVTVTVSKPSCRFNNKNYVEGLGSPWGTIPLTTGKYFGQRFYYAGNIWEVFADHYDREFDGKWGGEAWESGSVRRCPSTWHCLRGGRGSYGHGDNNFSVIIANKHVVGCYPTRLFLRWSGGCFLPDSKIRLADGSLKPVSAIREGDMVWNPVLKREFMVEKVVVGPEEHPIFEITTESSKMLRVTRDHPIPTFSGLVTAKEVKVGDLLQTALGDFERVKEVKSKKTKEQVWNFVISSEESSPKYHYVEVDGLVTGDLYLQKQLMKVKESVVSSATKYH